MRGRRSISATVALVALAACAGGPRPAPAPAPAAPAAPAPPAPVAPPSVPRVATTPAEYFPLAIGNSWTFLQRSPGQPAAHHTVRIIRRDPDGYFVDDQQGALRADADCLHDRLRRLLCRPFEPGASWTSVVSPAITEHYRIAAVGETITVAAGTFQGCIRVRSQARVSGVEQTAELTYAPAVGLIRIETFSVVGGTATPQLNGELESYRVATATR